MTISTRASSRPVSRPNAPRSSSTASALSRTANALGAHGLPLMGTGDWNDGMNLVGAGGKGESVWLAWFLVDVMQGMAEMADLLDRPELSLTYHKDRKALIKHVEQFAWDGEWYLRATFDDGTPLGSRRMRKRGSIRCRNPGPGSAAPPTRTGRSRRWNRRGATSCARMKGWCCSSSRPSIKSEALTRLHQRLSAGSARERRPIHPRCGVRLHTPWPPGLIGHAYQYDIASNLRPESLSGPNAGLTEVLIPAGYVTTAYDPVYQLTPDGKRYVSKASDQPTTIPAPGLPFSLVFRAEPGKEDVLLKIASAYEAASKRRVPPPNFGPV